MRNIKFFTDKTVKHNYLLIQIKDYLKIRDKDPSFFEQYDEVLIDPGVYQLKKSKYYKWEKDLNVGEFLDSLPNNHYFGCGKPSDMNPKHERYFLNFTWQMAQKYHDHPQYIVEIQYAWKDFVSFCYWFNKYNKLNVASNFIALGNLYRIQCVNKNDIDYVRNIIDYGFRNSHHSHIHVYGLTLRMFNYLILEAEKYNIDVSVDSTNWTRVVNKKCRKKLHKTLNKDKIGQGLCSCNKETRQLFFDEYLKNIRRKEKYAMKNTKEYDACEI